MSTKADWFDGMDKHTETESDPFAGAAVTTSMLPPPGEPDTMTVPEPTSKPGEIVHDLGQDEDGNGSYPQADRYNLDTPYEELGARLDVLLKREGNCFDAGITCAIKDHPEMTCSACPFHEVGQDTRKSALCRLAKEQERILSLMTAVHAASKN